MPLGIDVGNSTSSVACVRQKGIDILMNEASNRQTASLVGFNGKQRVAGESAMAQWQSNLRNTISDIKLLLGRRWEEIDVQKLAARVPYVIKGSETGGVVVQVDYDGREQTFSPEQLMAMLLKNLMQTAQRAQPGIAPEAVIAVPAYFTDAQRRAMMDAAEIAGINVLQLKNETAAAALAYGLPKSTEFPDDKAEPLHVLFVDMGQNATTVSAVAFNKSKLQVLGTAFDRNLGGRDFDEVLVNHFVDEFKQKTGMDLRTNSKGLHRLRVACQKLKITLLGVPKMPINVECLMNDTDFQSSMERDTFSELSQPLLDRLLEPVKQVLADTGLRFDQISSIQLVGSTTRLPFVVKTLKDFFGKEPGRSINSEECIAKGCALAAAMISPTFKVRDFSVVDASPFVVNLSWTGKKSSEEGQSAGNGSAVFVKNNILPCTKILNHSCRESFEITASYGDLSQLPEGASPLISHFTVSQIPDIDAPKIKVTIRLNPHGIINIEQACVIEEYEVEEEIPPTPTPTPASTPAAAAATPAAPEAATPKAAESDADGDSVMKDSAPAPEASGAAPAPDAPSNEGAEPMVGTEEGAPAAAAAEQAPETNSAPKRRIVKKKKKHPLNVRGSWTSLTPDTVKSLKEQEFTMAAQDRWIIETQDKRNELETYVYSMRDRLGGDLAPYITDEDRDRFNKLLADMEDWLYTDECSDAQKGQLQTKLDSLKDYGDPVLSRFQEETDRAVAAEKLSQAISEYRALATSLEERYAHITEDERKQALAECDSCQAFLTEKLAAQESVPKHQKPAFKAAELSMRATTLANIVRPIMNRPKPAAEKKPVEPTPAAPTTEAPKEPASEQTADSSTPETTPADPAVEPMALD